MRRSSTKRAPSAKVFAACNLAAILLLFGYVQWRIDKSASKDVHLGLPVWDVSANDESW